MGGGLTLTGVCGTSSDRVWQDMPLRGTDRREGHTPC